MLKLVREDKEFIFSLIPFLFLFGLSVVGIYHGLIHNDKFLYVLLILAFMSPSPYRLYIKVKDWLEMGRNGGVNQFVASQSDGGVSQSEKVTTQKETPSNVDEGESEDVPQVADDRMVDENDGGNTAIQAVKVRVLKDDEVSG